MLSIIIPLPNFSFFASASLKNIYETIGLDQSNFEVIFLVTKDVQPPITNLPFKMIKCPATEQKGIHLSLLNHALYNLPLREWVYVQHADTFWVDCNWGIDLKAAIENNPNKIAWAVPHGNCQNEFNCVQYKFALDSVKLTRTHDFAGVYNSIWFTKNQMDFRWGELKTDLPLSVVLEKAIHQNRVWWTNRGHEVRLGDFVDGSDLIGLEIGVNCPERLGTIPMLAKYIHCWDLFGIAYDLRQEQNVIVIDRPENKCVRSLHTYSWVSSNLFSLNQYRHKIFPWKVLQKMGSDKISKYKSALCFLLEKYKEETRSLGDEDTMGISKIHFKDREYLLP